ncbi:protein FAR1-RELATED SEQUENCE 5-like [Diospyros lotus]|uniref:protein FAR1-RELATED SEQUENCE 5-like n=1 Tax=Diospyros lotus TaxID=55363 RepID=UPI00225210C5|nr:protein FAR1-RELATED SEQUENCE 5-like [Diospyros lotus]XP_052206469.1 protein FAR1-RELATED SEQUENCE 5-like [Diospyros lotus]
METTIEDKFVPDESLVGLESGLLDVARNLEPYEGMLFESDEAAKTFYDAYARGIGFFTRIVSSRKSECDGSIISRRLACNKEGYNLSSQKTGRVRIRKRESKREGCMAMILVKREKPGKWVVTKFVKEHNHPLVVSSGKDRPSPDDKDRRIRELSSKLYQTNQRLAACREQLRTIMEHIEEHAQYLSRTVEGIVSSVKEVESEDQELSHPS